MSGADPTPRQTWRDLPSEVLERARADRTLARVPVIHDPAIHEAMEALEEQMGEVHRSDESGADPHQEVEMRSDDVGLSAERIEVIRRIYRHDMWESDWESLTSLVDRSGNTVRPLLDHIDAQAAQLARLKQEVKVWRHNTEVNWDGLEASEAQFARLRTALEFYADPDTYHAILFVPDPPCGEFMNDIGTVEYAPGWTEEKPGERARAALADANADHGDDGE